MRDRVAAVDQAERPTERTHVVSSDAALATHFRPGSSLGPREFMQLQQAAGNRAVGTLLSAPAVQRAPVDIVKSEQQITLDLSDKTWRSKAPTRGATQVVYVLRDAATGEVLKVGKTTIGSLVGRFGDYVTAGNRWGRKLVADVYTIRKRPGRTIGMFENEIRAGMKKIGHKLPWDNQDRKRKGKGIPTPKPLSDLELIHEVEQARRPPSTAKTSTATTKNAPEVTVTPPKVDTPPVGGAGTGAASTRLGVAASRLKTAGRFLAEAAPGLLLQAMLMVIFPPKVHVHNHNYGALSRQKIDPALQTALAAQAATFNKLTTADPAQSIWATVTVESEYRVATSGGDLHLHLEDLRFIEMKVTHEYLLVEGPKFQVGAGAKASKKVTYSIPIFGPATRGSEAAIRNFRTVREGLSDSSSKVRLAAMLAMYNRAKADSFLKNQLVRDLQPMLNDDESAVRTVAARLISRLKVER